MICSKKAPILGKLLQTSKTKTYNILKKENQTNLTPTANHQSDIKWHSFSNATISEQKPKEANCNYKELLFNLKTREMKMKKHSSKDIKDKIYIDKTQLIKLVNVSRSNKPNQESSLNLELYKIHSNKEEIEKIYNKKKKKLLHPSKGLEPLIYVKCFNQVSAFAASRFQNSK